MRPDTCQTCKFMDLTERKPGGKEDDTGMCRFPAPSVQAPKKTRPWPFCKLTDWCSHWVAREA